MRAREAGADIIVVGAGAAGLSAAIALAKAGFSVVVAGALEQRGGGRTVALFEASLRFYDALGLWPQLANQAAKIETIRMLDATGSRVTVPPIAFSASEIGLAAFGENIENDHLVEQLAAVAREIPSLSLEDERLVDLAYGQDQVTAIFESGRRIDAKLIIAADGQRSTVRTKARIGARRWTYPQVALTVLTAHEKPHRNTSIEFHTRNGPCTLVPLPATVGAPHRSSLVWLMAEAEAARRRSLDAPGLAAEIEQQVQAIFGPMRLDGPCGSFPMTGLRVSRLTGRRVALLGEAAHVFPPLAAQGLNLSLRDTAALVDCVETARARGEDIGAAATLVSYAAARRPDISLRTHGIDILNRSLLADFLPVDLLRGVGFLAFSMIGPLRRAVMREGILPDGHLPPLMQRPRSRPTGANMTPIAGARARQRV
ncbi:FAD-dependent monooxygenase [Methylovirgula sp. HY1]|uniref:FAD-dependent monooxygenase n=1 Tax=Methylovirgula sp. HY1 TaxID=2822761 RepID=UPI001C5BEEC9|nr:FAD-dependent monooxygenase [Methylovirgula sp. HY1]QXX73812.1 2-octaprenyl-3-methyl-6-methoxy-1,4-benzoquinol hydroxylase [Methylovirgula sp. HY1]